MHEPCCTWYEMRRKQFFLSVQYMKTVPLHFDSKFGCTTKHFQFGEEGHALKLERIFSCFQVVLGWASTGARSTKNAAASERETVLPGTTSRYHCHRTSYYCVIAFVDHTIIQSTFVEILFYLFYFSFSRVLSVKADGAFCALGARRPSTYFFLLFGQNSYFFELSFWWTRPVQRCDSSDNEIVYSVNSESNTYSLRTIESLSASLCLFLNCEFYQSFSIDSYGNWFKNSSKDLSLILICLILKHAHLTARRCTNVEFEHREILKTKF